MNYPVITSFIIVHISNSIMNIFRTILRYLERLHITFLKKSIISLFIKYIHCFLHCNIYTLYIFINSGFSFYIRQYTLIYKRFHAIWI